MNQTEKKFYNLFSESKILINEPLSKYTNTRTGGPADLLAFPQVIDELKNMIIEAKKLAIPVTVVGNASNLIVKDGGIRGLVLILVKLNQIKIENKNVVAQAGASLIDTTEAAYKLGLTGLEFAAGIPGSIGGAIFMNAGAYGGEISKVVHSVTILTRSGEIRVYQNGDLDFGYRHSRIQDEKDIVLSARFGLEIGNKKKIREAMDDFNFLRASKQPLEYPSCGSVFKRPEGHYTGKLIHDAGLQGFQIGGAQVSLKHAGFIVNVGFATASDYLAVIKHIQETILDKFHVQLETEVRIIGENS
ncbi:UDP-N-acetylmuramate dehydrogenase [Liquorilactobacillus uvarum]|uniref:UDP-N-acetylenolpyruvoylglucosamine reductase n=1 Tax=Liquorilactobacillus uvarum DSM 19971 TaxID=1423812 RepID=A0A0R1PZ47_9LACO|nr:UDP-N-acetylmuramate dehydrogenase [Liquorilactobacillus uvarum]KRL33400.1 murB protein [Liquorilactobacillus uvarum DSM 19971]